jgi:hypothetical protein
MCRLVSQRNREPLAEFHRPIAVSNGSFNTSPVTISLPNLSSVKITAVGPTNGTALNSRFIINQLLLTVAGTGGSANPATTVTTTGVNGNRQPFVTFASVAGESCEVQCSTDLATWTSMATRSGTGNSVTYTDEFTDASVSPRKFHRVLTVQTPNGNFASSTLSITQTWA